MDDSEDIMVEQGDGGGGFFGGQNDTYTEVHHESYFSRIGNSFGGICVGIVLFFGAFPLLWWNEGRAVDYYQAINEGRKIVIPINTTAIDATNEGKLVYLTGLAEPTDAVSDEDFGIQTNMKTRLSRKVEMYQWKEKKTTRKENKVGGGTTTITEYTYSKAWSASLIDSSTFKKTGYINPTSMPYTSKDFYPTAVMIDAFTLPTDLINGISSLVPLGGTYNISDIPSSNLLVSSMTEQSYTNGYYFGATSTSSYTNSQVGDTRVTYSAASGGQVSIIAKQTGSTFAPYTASSGANLYRIEQGIVSSTQMFDNAKAENKTMTMILRFVGFIVMAIGLGIMLGPIAVMADIIPCIGDCVGAAVAIVAGMTAAVLSLVVIGIAWVANRPVILAVGGAGLAVVLYFVYRGYQKKQEKSRALDFNESAKDLEMDR